MTSGSRTVGVLKTLHPKIPRWNVIDQPNAVQRAAGQYP